ncbi:rRNA methyltransferase [Desulfocarbo indianensis]|nr:rRNA methyltransferase [Desulfocarbo indianensis]
MAGAGKGKRQRLDQRLVERGLAASRSKAAALILAGLVKVDGRKAVKAGAAVAEGALIELAGPDHPYVSRGGVKLAGALEHFGLEPRGWQCLDVGASTGGFSDCLLQRGAARVTALDVGYGQLAWKLRQDPRVECIERVNVRHLPPDSAPGPFDLIVVDVSFISLTLVTPPLAARLKPGGSLLVMVKPQFEAGRELVGSGGVVRDAAVRQACVDKIAGHLAGLGLTILGDCPSPITGPKGNLEHFLLARADR